MKRPNECVSGFCGIHYLPYAMRLICALVIISSLSVLTPVTFLCHLSVIKENNYLSISAGIAALAICIVVFLCLLCRTPLIVHLVLNIVWLVIATVHIVSTIYLFTYYIVVKPLHEEGCTIGGVLFFIFWFFNMIMMGSGLLVYWSTFTFMYNDPFW